MHSDHAPRVQRLPSTCHATLAWRITYGGPTPLAARPTITIAEAIVAGAVDIADAPPARPASASLHCEQSTPMHTNLSPRRWQRPRRKLGSGNGPRAWGGARVGLLDLHAHARRGHNTRCKSTLDLTTTSCTLAAQRACGGCDMLRTTICSKAAPWLPSAASHTTSAQACLSRGGTREGARRPKLSSPRSRHETPPCATKSNRSIPRASCTMVGEAATPTLGGGNRAPQPGFAL